MLTAVVTVAGSSVEVELPQSFVSAEAEVPESDLNPIAPELKEMAWGFGAFLVLFIAMRLWLFPAVKKGIDARYKMIRDDVEGAETLTASARSEVAEYEAQLAAVKAEANARIEAAREALEAERQAKLAEVNARIAERRAAAVAEVEAAREAVRGQIESAVADVAARAGELATGRRPDDAVVRDAVAAAMSAGVAR